MKQYKTPKQHTNNNATPTHIQTHNSIYIIQNKAKTTFQTNTQLNTMKTYNTQINNSTQHKTIDTQPTTTKTKHVSTTITNKHIFNQTHKQDTTDNTRTTTSTQTH